MAKKVFLTILFAFVLILGLSTISFAKTDNTTTTLGDEVTSSMNKTERSMDDLVDRTNLDDAGRTIENGARAVGNAVSTGMDNIGRGAEDFVDGNDNERVDNRAVAGTTGNYTAGQITGTGGDTTTTRNGMTGNAWIWIVMVVVALVIVASVWLYAAQRD